MFKNKKLMIGIITLITALMLSACGGANDENQNENADMNQGTEENTGMDHSEMNHSTSGEVPENLKEAENPKYPVGTKAIIKEGHMEGMKGAEATIVGAYDTTAYAISYTPTTGGEPVENHKWVIHEELVDAGEEPLAPGDEVQTEASHMEGMKGATVKIDSAERTTVYMIDFTPTTGGEEVKNHKWVTENELAPAAK
ncbi:YdhK family protein (plasmid) [Paenibacillus urinalis]|uniref:YdhK family protein n=1 Tax=Paenibacillus urinalis TaxID=521520 RepID=A0AAX3N9E8_9BACL|nr:MULTISPECIES: YdhK family protein [Paenibacillus]WDH85357.1 YdhK family protein [Paenibacillus urinalis]WDH95205.1 YdhK family protein [Paenibacillus urinalis]WDI05321.1 YdhK family protein [Paenibacillus urinalis]